MRPFNYVWQYLGKTLAEFAAVLKPYLGSSEPTYKVYTALLTQTGTDAPVATVLENTIGNIWFEYSSPGYYLIKSNTDVFTANKTYTVLQLWGDDGVSPKLGYVSYDTSSELGFTLTDVNGVLSNTLGNNNNPVVFLTSIEIRVYN